MCTPNDFSVHCIILVYFKLLIFIESIVQFTETECRNVLKLYTKYIIKHRQLSPGWLCNWGLLLLPTPSPESFCFSATVNFSFFFITCDRSDRNLSIFSWPNGRPFLSQYILFSLFFFELLSCKCKGDYILPLGIDFYGPQFEANRNVQQTHWRQSDNFRKSNFTQNQKNIDIKLSL